MNRLILGGLNENIQSSGPTLVVLEISIVKVEKEENKYFIKLRHFISSNTEKLISEAECKIEWFENLSDELSCYYSTAINLLGISTRRIDIEKLTNYTSNRVLELITYNKDLQITWKKFLENVEFSENNLGVVIGMNMASSLTFPLEHLKAATNKNVELIILKSSLKRFDVKSLNDNLPKRVVIILGMDYPGEDSLDFNSELKRIYELFGKLDSYEYSRIKVMGDSIKYIKNNVEYIVDIYPQKCNLDTIENEINKINEPYLLIYTGHGIDTGINPPRFYPRGYIDGELGINGNGDSKTLQHIDFVNILVNNPPRGIIFNCCSALRGFTFRGEESDIVEGLENFESSYYKLLEKTKFIIAHRTKICSISATIKTVSLTESFIWDKSIIDMLTSMVKKEYTCETEWRNDKREYCKIIRDYLSGVFWIN